VKSHKDSHRP